LKVGTAAPHRDPRREGVGRGHRTIFQTNGQMLLPIVNWIESASQLVETVIPEIGIQTIEMVLRLSAEQVAAPGAALRIRRAVPGCHQPKNRIRNDERACVLECTFG
jgi:hypothetical protein